MCSWYQRGRMKWYNCPKGEPTVEEPKRKKPCERWSCGKVMLGDEVTTVNMEDERPEQYIQWKGRFKSHFL